MRTYLLLSICLYFAVGVKASDVLFETNFTTAEGWIQDGSTSTPVVSGSQEITYKNKQFKFSYTRCEIVPEGKTSASCGKKGFVSVGKNGNSDLEKVSTSEKQGYFRLPSFGKEIQISFSRSSSKKDDRVMALEYSLDGGNTWLCDSDCIASLIQTPEGSKSEICEVFDCKKKFPVQAEIRICVHSNGGMLKLNWLQIRTSGK